MPEDYAMNKALIAWIVLGGSTTFACAQDATDATGHAGTGDVPGGHGVAVFTGQPEGHDADWTLAPQRATDARVGGDGTIVLGRQYNLEYLTRADVGDPFHTGTAGKASKLVNPSGTPVGSAVRYYSSRIDNVSTGGSWTVDTLGGSAMADRAWGMTVGVDYGPLSLRAAHQNRHVAEVQLYNLAGSNMDAKNSIVAANLRTRWGTAYAAYAANRGWGSSPLYNPDNPYGVDRQPRHHRRHRRADDALDHVAGLLHPQERPRPGQPRRQPVRARRQLRGVAQDRFLCGGVAHHQYQRQWQPDCGRSATERQFCGERGHAPRILRTPTLAPRKSKNG
jgi:hypothetical protein